MLRLPIHSSVSFHPCGRIYTLWSLRADISFEKAATRCDVPRSPVVIATDAKIRVKNIVHSLLKAIMDARKVNQVDQVRNMIPVAVFNSFSLLYDNVTPVTGVTRNANDW